MGKLFDHAPIPRDRFTPEFYRRFQKYVVPGDTCWEWAGSKRGKYGTVTIAGARYRAHRVAWAIHFGDIPEGLCVCHRCDNPVCVRPSHLWLGTHQDNQEDKLRKGWQARKRQRGL